MAVAGPLGLCQATVPDESMADALLRAHLSVALVVIGLTVARLVHAAWAGRPEVAPTVVGSHRRAVVAGHRLLLATLAALVTSGIVVWVTAGLPLAPWSASSAEVAGTSGAALAHRLLALVFVGLAVAHVVGVTVHDAVHPGTIDRMRRSRQPGSDATVAAATAEQSARVVSSPGSAPS